METLASDERFVTNKLRVKHREALLPLIQDVLRYVMNTIAIVEISLSVRQNKNTGRMGAHIRGNYLFCLCHEQCALL